VLLRLAYLTVTNTFAALRLLPMSDRDKDVEILVLRHQLGVLQRQLGTARPALTAADRSVPVRAARPAASRRASPTAASGAPGYRVALAPGLDRSPSCEGESAETARTL
jgi:hypothetical protein